MNQPTPYLMHGLDAPLYLTGVSNNTIRMAAATNLAGRLGILLGPDTCGSLGGRKNKVNYLPHLADFSFWGLDNGCFSSKGAFDAPSWLELIDHLVDIPDMADRCCFAVAPDVFLGMELGGDMPATIERSLPVLPEIRKRGLPAALVFQDNVLDCRGLIPWDDFDVAFLGGLNAFKLGYPVRGVGSRNYTYDPHSLRTMQWADLLLECHERGKIIHMGRVSGAVRMALCRECHIASADGTFLGQRGTQGLHQIDSWTKLPFPKLETNHELGQDQTFTAARPRAEIPPGPRVSRCQHRRQANYPSAAGHWQHGRHHQRQV